MKSLMNFSDSALTRSEMKNVKGGMCYAQSKTLSPGKVQNGSKADMKAYAEANGTRWCCSRCGTATWMPIQE